MPKIDLSQVPGQTGSTYPAPYNEQLGERTQYKLGKHAGLTQFGANLVRLAPGAMSSLRHWHENQDEFLVVMKGTCTLIDEGGETKLSTGDCAAFPAGDENGHHLVNRESTDAEFLVVGTHTSAETGHYSDIDMIVTAVNGTFEFTKRDGSKLDDA